MRDKFTTIIITFVVISIMAVLVIFGLIVYDEITKNIEIDMPIDIIQHVSSEEEKTIDDNIETPKILENTLSGIEGTSSSSNKNINYQNVVVDKYFYNQLEEYSKTIYKAFESNKEHMKTGTYEIELGEAFSDILAQENGQDLLGKYYQSAIEAYTYDNPDVFYLSPNKMYLNIETITKGRNVTYNVYINSGDQSNYLSNEFTTNEQIDNAFNQIQRVKDGILQNITGNAYNDVKTIHDYLVNNVSYDSSISKPNIYNIYGALVNKESVCEGYARSMKYLLDSINVPCVLVIGKGTNSDGRTENHAWNYVQINNKWYALDATWDDPISATGYVSETSKYKYFLKGSNEFNKDHIPNGQFTEGGKIFTYPTLNTTNYN